MLDIPCSVLLIDDDAALRALMETFFTSRQIRVATQPDATDLSGHVARLRPSIVVLDLMMPGVDGLQALRALRASGDATPVIMLTARDEGVDRIVGLESGADDYVGKPFMPQELLARIQAVLRRHRHIPELAARHSQTDGTVPWPAHETVRAPLATTAHSYPVMAQSAAQFCFGRFTLDFVMRRLQRDGETIRLTNSEFTLLSVLARHPHEALSRPRLLSLWHGGHAAASERGIDVPIFRLRRILERDPARPEIIQTIRNAGYMFVPPPMEQDTSHADRATLHAPGALQ
ncbi:response regulator [Robbsia andropogonis]|uniref:response regulator n=1 Tax=Robbsia andropogonis TaxID=28092 RepID=UPI000464CF01|nr:response regulator [Robbsia andropogonis]